MPDPSPVPWHRTELQKTSLIAAPVWPARARDPPRWVWGGSCFEHRFIDFLALSFATIARASSPRSSAG
jgi:hypothetical protein